MTCWTTGNHSLARSLSLVAKQFNLSFGRQRCSALGRSALIATVVGTYDYVDVGPVSGPAVSADQSTAEGCLYVGDSGATVVSREG